ncbi:MAG TPA: circularly permuted type 2 ATP-grasp protein, partial [Pirellulales bacterium]|nr:circularly permuted type 2 ATP-grasp protein [Pirellulales bacterium]
MAQDTSELTLMRPSLEAETADENASSLAYCPRGDVYDEMVASSAAVRPHWQKLLAELESLGPAGITRNAQHATSLVHDNRVTYHTHERAADTPWEVDTIPLVLPPGEWNSLAAGLAQRARLLNEIVADLYGPQRLLHEGLLPAELVFAHPGFLWACHGSRVPHQQFVHFYAAHLGRAPDGRWTVLADRANAPTGAGYAVENRIVISRTLSTMFDDLQVQRLAPFFVTLRETLRNLATHHRDNPRIVLLTAGPESRTYFEDMYLARYLGYTMIEGGDLTVRDNMVFLKTLGGLLPVDVIFRRLSDEDCDPLELRGDTMTGVPGLVNAARRNHVVIANALGTGMLEAPFLQAFLPAICRALLSEELRLPAVGTWWCGDEGGLRHTLANFGQLIIKPVFDARSTRPVVGDQLSNATREELIARIRHRPHEFVAQEHIACSSAPIWNGTRLEPWHAALRTFAVASGDSYQVMPGGLPRVFHTVDQLSDSMAAGQASKDVWVLSDGPVEQVTLLRPSDAPIELRRSGNDLPSRVAENLYWLGRQVERVEGTVRLLRTIVGRLSSEADPSTLPDLFLMVESLNNTMLSRKEIALLPAQELRHRLVSELLALVYDEGRVASVRASLQALRAVASVVRDRISVDSWRTLTLLDDDVQPMAPSPT